MNTNNQKQVNIIGWFFVSIAILSLSLPILALFLNFSSITVTYAVRRLNYVIPLVLIPVFNEDIKYKTYFRKIKLKSVFITIIIALLSLPTAIFLNLLSQEITENAVIKASGSMMSTGAIFLTVLTGLVTPLLEEMCFRGVMFETFKEFTPKIKAIFVSALCFGLIHMNFNQFCYAFYMGLIFCFINIASGSLITSVISHILINLINIGILFIANISGDKQASSANGDISILIGLTFIVAAISTPLLCICIKWLAQNEGRPFNIQDMIAEAGHIKTRTVINVPFILGIMICVAIMILL